MRLAHWLVAATVVATGAGCLTSPSTTNAIEAACPGFAQYVEATDGSIPLAALARLRHFGIDALPTWEYADALGREGVVRGAVSVFSCRGSAQVEAVELMRVSGLPGGSQRAMWVVYVTGVIQHSFGPWPSNGNPGLEFDFVDPHGLDDTAAVVF